MKGGARPPESGPRKLNPRFLLRYCRSELPALLTCLRRAVEIESPTNSPADVNRLARFFAKELKRLHGKVKVLRHPTAGSRVWAESWPENRPRKPVPVLGTIHPACD